MSRHPVHVYRRAWILWLPLILTGALTVIHSYTLTLTANGLTLLGLATVAAGTITLATDAPRL